MLIPHSDVNPMERLPMMKCVERDEEYMSPISYPKSVRDFDVLLGRGGLSNKQCGNLWSRNLVAKYRYEYITLPKGGKRELARSIGNYVWLSGGRFLEKRINDRMNWYECGDERARAKFSQEFREAYYVSYQTDDAECEDTSLSTDDSGDSSS
jgi:hypothetical protein